MQIVPDFFFEDGVAAIVRTFKKHGLASEARMVGGCVRDALLGRPCNDVDFSTTLTPDEITALFGSEGFGVEPTGIEHGTVTVIWNHHPYEITTLRRDVETDGRRAVVEFSKDWREDAERRDFTINALYLDFEGNLHDPWGNDYGFENLTDRKLVFVGDAETRIREDALRIIRLYRFMSVLDFQPDWTATEACSKLHHLIGDLSGERLEKESLKLVSGPAVVPAIGAMIADGVFESMFGFTPNAMAISRRFRRRAELGMMDVAPINLLWMWDHEAAEKVCQRWKTSHAVRKATVDVVKLGPIDLHEATRDSLWAEAHRNGIQGTLTRIKLSVINTGRGAVTQNRVQEMIDWVWSTPNFPIRGQDLLDAGMKPGREVGQRLKEIENWWIEGGFPSEEVLRSRLKLVEN